MQTAAADWYPDPTTPGRTRLRYWDGTTWTDEVRDADAAPQTAPTEPTPGASGRRVPLVGVRQLARELIAENDALAEDNVRLRRAVQHYGIEDVVRRTIALDDLTAEIGVQEARLEGLLAHVRGVELGLVPSRRYPHQAKERERDGARGWV